MCSANLQDFSTEVRGEGMQLVQSTNIIELAFTRTPLSAFQMLASDTGMAGPGVTKFPGFPHEIGRVSNPCPFSVKLAVAAIIQNHKAPQNQRPGNLPVPKHCGMAVLHKPNQIRIFLNKIINDLQCLGYKSVC